MPCRDDGSCDRVWKPVISKDALKEKQKRLDNFVAMMCKQCKVLDALGDDDVFTTEMKEWWERHKVADAAREEAERVAAEEKRKKEEAKRAKIRAEKMAQYNQLKVELGL